MPVQFEIAPRSLERQPSLFTRPPGAYHSREGEYRRASDHTWRRREGPPRRFPSFYYDVGQVFLVDNDGLVHVIELPEQHPPASSSPESDFEYDVPGAIPVVDAVLVSQPLLVEATPVSRQGRVPRRGRLKETLTSARRFFSRKKKARRQASANPNYVAEDSNTEPDVRSEEGTDPVRPGASRVEPDPENPDYETSRDAPVDNSPEGRHGRGLRRFVRLHFQLGVRRDVVEAQVQVFQRRGIDVVEESPRIGEDGSSRVPLDDLGGSTEVPLLLAQDATVALVGRSDESPMITQDSSVALDEFYASQFVTVPTKKAEKTDPNGAESRDTKPAWGRPTVKSDKDEDDDAAAAAAGNERAGSSESPSEHAPSRSSLEESLRAAREENQRLRDELQSSIAERETHQEELHTAREENQLLQLQLQSSVDDRELMIQENQGLRIVETAYRRSLARNVELQKKNEELEAALQKKDREMEAALQLLDRVLETALQEKDRVLAALQEKDRVLAALQEKDRELEASLELNRVLETALQEKDRVLEGANAEGRRRVKGMKVELDAAAAKVRELSQELVSLRDELRASVSEHESTHQAHQAKLHKAEADHAMSISQKEDELHKMISELAEAKLERKRLEEKLGEFEQKLEAMAGQLEAFAGQKRHVAEESQQCRNTSSVDQGQKRRRIHDACPCGSECDSRPSEECSDPPTVDCDSEDSGSYTSDCDCSESSASSCDDSTADGHELFVVSCEAQIWSEQDVRDATAVCEELTNREVLAHVSLEQDVTPEFTYPFRPEEVQWAEAVALCGTWHFPSGAPTDLMGKVALGILQTLRHSGSDSFFRLKQIVCYRSSLVISTEVAFPDPYGVKPRMLPVEMLVALVDKESPLCVDTQEMASESQRLIFCAKGFVGNNGHPIRRGGHGQVLASIQGTLRGVLVNTKEVACPTCLQTMHPHRAATLNHKRVKLAASRSVMCRHGHRVDVTLICGPSYSYSQVPSDCSIPMRRDPVLANAPRSVLMVAVLNVVTRRWVRIGTGFVVDRRLGLILTAAHTVKLKSQYFPRRFRQYRIGLETDDGVDFRYTAEIIVDGPARVDACILRITGPVANARTQVPLLSELEELALASEWFLEENVRLVGYNQGGEGTFPPGSVLDHQRDVVRGYVCKLYKSRIEGCIRNEIVVIGGQVIRGHSGGPCFNSRGEVLGLLSRTDSYYHLRWYLVPFTELLLLLETARKRC